MPDLQAIDLYLSKLPYTEPFTDLVTEAREKVAFGAWEMLRRRYGSAVITTEMTALQALYLAEGESEEFAKFRRQNVNNVSLDGMSFAFQPNSGHNISPEVVALISNLDTDEPMVFFGELR